MHELGTNIAETIQGDTHNSPALNGQIQEDRWLKLPKELWYMISTYLEKWNIAALHLSNKKLKESTAHPKDLTLRRVATQLNFNLLPQYRYLALVPGGFNQEELESFYQLYLSPKSHLLYELNCHRVVGSLNHIALRTDKKDKLNLTRLLTTSAEQSRQALFQAKLYHKPNLNEYPLLILLEYMHCFSQYFIKTNNTNFSWLLKNLPMFKLSTLALQKLKILNRYCSEKLNENEILLYRNRRLFANPEFMDVILASAHKDKMTNINILHGAITLWQKGLWQEHNHEAFLELDVDGWHVLADLPTILDNPTNRNIIANGVEFKKLTKTAKNVVMNVFDVTNDIHAVVAPNNQVKYVISGFKFLNSECFRTMEVFPRQWNMIDFFELGAKTRGVLVMRQQQCVGWPLKTFASFCQAVYDKKLRDRLEHYELKALRNMSFIDINKVPEIKNIQALRSVLTTWRQFGGDGKFGESHLHREIVKRCMQTGTFCQQTWDDILSDPVVQKLFARNIPKISNWFLDYIFNPRQFDKQATETLDALMENIDSLPNRLLADLSSPAHLEKHAKLLDLVAAGVAHDTVAIAYRQRVAGTVIESLLQALPDAINHNGLLELFSVDTDKLNEFFDSPIYFYLLCNCMEHDFLFWAWCSTNINKLKQFYNDNPFNFRHQLSQLATCSELFVNEVNGYYTNRNVTTLRLSWFSAMYTALVQNGDYNQQWLCCLFDPSSESQQMFARILNGGMLDFFAFTKATAKSSKFKLQSYNNFYNRNGLYKEIDSHCEHAYMFEWFFNQWSLSELAKVKYDNTSCLTWLSYPSHQALLQLFFEKSSQVFHGGQFSLNCKVKIQKNGEPYRLWVNPLINNKICNNNCLEFLKRLTRSGLISKPQYVLQLLDDLPLYLLTQFNQATLAALASAKNVEALNAIVNVLPKPKFVSNADAFNATVQEKIFNAQFGSSRKPKPKEIISNPGLNQSITQASSYNSGLSEGEFILPGLSHVDEMESLDEDAFCQEKPSDYVDCDDGFMYPVGFESLTRFEVDLLSTAAGFGYENGSEDGAYNPPDIYNIPGKENKNPQDQKRPRNPDVSDFVPEKPLKEESQLKHFKKY